MLNAYPINFDKYKQDYEKNFRSTLIQIIQEISEEYAQARSIWNLLIQIVKQLPQDQIHTFLNSPKGIIKYNESGIATENDEAGYAIQNKLHPLQRKKLAANYTTIDAAKILTDFLVDKRIFRKIADPFCGSGRLITSVLEKEKVEYESQKIVPNIWINDILLDAVLIAYLRIIHVFKKNHSDWKNRIKNITVTIGDAFQQSIGKGNDWDLIIMNPPYTRVEHLSKELIQNLKIDYSPNSKLLKGQPGLHIYAIFFANLLLQPEGKIAAVLPASTFLSQYSRDLQFFLMDQYHISQIIISVDQKSFSDDSQFREILFYGTKYAAQRKQIDPTKFIRISSNNKGTGSENSPIISILEINSQKLQTERNWIKFLLPPELQNWANKIVQSKFIKSGQQIGLNLVRGVEMYGPDFFFLPNKYWDIQSISSDHVILIEKKESMLKSHNLSIEIEYLTRCFRKPGLYNNQITPNLQEYAIKIPNTENISQNLDYYIKQTENAADPAKKQFGNKWKSHIEHQLQTKSPFGHLFFADKFGINTTGTFIYYSDVPVTCTKNFYVVKNFHDLSNKKTQLLGAWLSSSWYLLLFLYHRREIGGSYGRLQIMDLLSEPLFIDIAAISQEIENAIIEEFDHLRREYLPPIPNQLQLKTKWKLDTLFAQALGWNEKEIGFQLSNLYSIIIQELQDCELRDN
jgi:hypothetical protein